MLGIFKLSDALRVIEARKNSEQTESVSIEKPERKAKLHGYKFIENFTSKVNHK